MPGYRHIACGGAICGWVREKRFGEGVEVGGGTRSGRGWVQDVAFARGAWQHQHFAVLVAAGGLLWGAWPEGGLGQPEESAEEGCGVLLADGEVGQEAGAGGAGEALEAADDDVAIEHVELGADVR